MLKVESIYQYPNILKKLIQITQNRVKGLEDITMITTNFITH